MWIIRACIAKSTPGDYDAFLDKKSSRHVLVLKKTLKNYNKLYNDIFDRERNSGVAFAIAVANEGLKNDTSTNDQSNIPSVTPLVMYDERSSEFVAKNDINDNTNKNSSDDNNIDKINNNNNIEVKQPKAPPDSVFLYIIIKGIEHYKVGFTAGSEDGFISRYHSHVGEFSYLKFDVVHEDMTVAEARARAIEAEFKRINERHRTYCNLEFFHKRDCNEKHLLPRYKRSLVRLIRKHLQLQVSSPYIISPSLRKYHRKMKRFCSTV